MTTTEDRLATALRTRAAGVTAVPDLPAAVARSGRIRLRRVGASAVAGLAVVALVVTGVGLGDHRRTAEPAGPSHVFAPIARSPLTLRVSASQVALGSTVFIWGGQKTTATYHGPT